MTSRLTAGNAATVSAPMRSGCALDSSRPEGAAAAAVPAQMAKKTEVAKALE
ncbi:MAG: hypothetical protein ACREFO_16510 [Acetobacteraceae bacterium]